MGVSVGGKSGGVKSDINVTPLVDIVLVLLIIFIVMTPAVNDSVKMPLAKHSPKAEKDTKSQYLTVLFNAKREGGKYVGPGLVMTDSTDVHYKGMQFDINSESEQGKPFGDGKMLYGKPEFVKMIQKNTAALDDKKVFVKADADLTYKEIDKLFKALKEGGADEAAVVTGEDKKKDEEKK